jgi:hypothetical protein
MRIRASTLLPSDPSVFGSLLYPATYSTTLDLIPLMEGRSCKAAAVTIQLGFSLQLTGRMIFRPILTPLYLADLAIRIACL